MPDITQNRGTPVLQERVYQLQYRHAVSTLNFPDEDSQAVVVIAMNFENLSRPIITSSKRRKFEIRLHFYWYELV